MKRFALTAAAILVLCIPQLWAQEQPYNDPLAVIGNRPRPNVMLLVDTSGSMLWDSERPGGYDITVRIEDSLRYVDDTYYFGRESHKVYLIDSDHPQSRLGQAKSAIREMISQIPDINLGIGRFEKTLALNRFRGTVPAGYRQRDKMPGGYRFEFIDGQEPNDGEINVPDYRWNVSTEENEYPFARVERRYDDSGAYSYWTVYDTTDVVWLTSTSSTQYIGGDLYVRLFWDANEIHHSRYMQYRALTAAGDQIFRATYGSPDATHRNKLNQIDNIDIFLSDTDFIQLKANTTLGDTLTVESYVVEAYGVPVRETLTFEYYPTCADWDGNTSCANGEVLVDIQDRFGDDPDTPEDESDNKPEIAASVGPITTNALIYDFSVEPAELTNLGPFFGLGGTPLAATLTAAKNYFENTITPRDQMNNVEQCRDNFVILLTDGYETCGGSPETIAADLYDSLGIKVYVIAFVITTAQADAIAVAGGTEEAFRAENRQELVDALKEVLSEIKDSFELATPVAGSSATSATSIIDGDIVLLPFFDFPGFSGRLQARKLFKFAVVSVDPTTGAIVTDGSGNPVILEDDIDEDRVVQLIEDPTNPIEQDPSREIVGLQLDPPAFLWDAGELLSQQIIELENPDLVYPHLKPDVDDLDGDGDYSELIVNPAYKTADERNILTTLEFTTQPEVIGFNTAELIDDPANHDTAVGLLGVGTWSDRDIRFLVNYARGKVVNRFDTVTELYGTTFNPGDPVPDPSSPDDNGDGVPDGFLYSERQWKLGDFISSTPVFLTPPSGTFPININDNDNSLHDYEEFVEANANIPTITVIGSNDGMLHGFNVLGIDLNDDDDFDDAGEYYPGEEVWAFVLPDAMDKIQQLFYDAPDDDDFEPDGQQLDPHWYFIDAPMTLAIVRARVHSGDTDDDGKSDDPEFRLMLFTGEGRGGNRYWAFDVTDPMNPVPIWSLTDTTMGNTLSRPAVGPVEVGPLPELDNDTFRYYAFMGSGFDYTQTDGSATVGNVLYQVDINDGTIVNSFSAGDVSGGAGIPNAIVSRAIMVDEDDDFFIERIYFGDLDGNIWRWNLVDGQVDNLLDISAMPLTTESERLDRPILDSITYANIFGFNIITAATGGDTRRYLDEDLFRSSYPQQRIYLLVDTDREGNVRSLLDGQINDQGDYEETGDTVGIDLQPYRVAENIPVVTAFTEYDESGQIYRGFQTFHPIYIPDPAGQRTIRCTFGSSELVILDSIFSESNIVESTSGVIIDMGEGKATGITYVGGNILFSLGNQFKVYGQGIYRFESSQRVKARLKVMRWHEVF